MGLKVMVVDDERPIREWLVMILEKSREYVEYISSASNGEEAYLKYLLEKPHLIITDIHMPIMDGIELMEKIKAKDKDTVFVVLTCHEDFAYARRALQLGADDYLLKTEIDKKQLNDILEKIISLHSNTSKTGDAFFDRQRLVIDLLENKRSPDESQMKKLGIIFEGKDYFVFAMKSDKSNSLSESQNILRMEGYKCEFLPYDKKVLFAIVLTNRNSSMLMQLNKIQEFSTRVYDNFKTVIGVSKMYTSVTELGKAMKGALKQLNHGFYDCYKSTIMEDFEFPSKEEYDYEKIKNSLIHDIFLVHKDDIFERIKNWINNVGLYGEVDSGQFKIDIIYILNKLKEKYRTISFQKEFIIEAENFDEMKLYVINVLEHWGTYDNLTVSSYVIQALDYIEKNYLTNCSLEQVADYVGLNPEYFSRLFKQNMKQTFSAFLTGYRIEIAKKLLIETNYNISDIAEKVGYQNLAYFSRVFKKTTGQTPFDYRK